MLIPGEFLTDKIRATIEYKEYEKKKRKQVAGETSSPRKSLNVTIKQKQPSTTPIPPPSDDIDRDEIAEATLLSLTMHKTSLGADAQEKVAKFQEKLMEEDIEKMLDEAEEESYAKPGSHKENPEVVDDDDVDDNVDKDKKNDNVEENKDKKNDDNDDHVDHTLVRGEVLGSLETRNEQT
ncbi:hypothetical protein Tco_0516148 [Tanacetum coccineum]